jgi:hypothetical protein
MNLIHIHQSNPLIIHFNIIFLYLARVRFSLRFPTKILSNISHVCIMPHPFHRSSLQYKTCYFLVYICLFFININLYNCSCNCICCTSNCICIVFIVCSVSLLFVYFCLSVMLFCVMCLICVLCLIVLPLPPGKNPFTVKTNNNIIWRKVGLTNGHESLLVVQSEDLSSPIYLDRHFIFVTVLVKIKMYVFKMIDSFLRPIRYSDVIFNDTQQRVIYTCGSGCIIQHSLSSIP